MVKKKLKADSIALKLVFIFAIVILLIVANLFTGSKLSDREYEYNHAKEQICSGAGGEFYINDCYLVIPYSYKVKKYNSKGEPYIVTEWGREVIRPASVNANAELKTQMRPLGIYSAPIFTGEMNYEASFDFTELKAKTQNTYSYAEAKYCVEISDRSLVEKPVFKVGDKEYKVEYSEISYNSGDSKSMRYSKCIMAKIPLNNKPVVIKSDYKIRGASDFSLKIVSQETKVKISSDWPSPGFSSFAYIPTEHELTKDGFTASWYIPFDAGNGSNEIGFTYVQSVDVYRKLHRAFNYAFLFIIVPFIALFLLEIFADINLHPVNYLLSGAASVLFFLLLLALSEHINFGLSYALGSAASGLLVSVYIALICKKINLGGIIALLFVLLYGYLYVCLQSEDYALLFGSIFAFIVLAAIMFVTRNVNWSSLKKSKEKDLIEE
ncbi:cell envelope integrity protein CreD [Treponema sp.]|uniref:cell envelope integrity protein CreD n=1 Tax=Treponema sp. TaxID=166 RepID=UPI00298E5A2D|nr:cell envelope integrity protein CreD [Treponema sp.]MCR5613712.1 cell envelope integrity protein CreD [Treponema sp.]